MSDPKPDQTAIEWRESLGYDEVTAIHAARRCGVVWDPWMGDWFTSWSPRNDNANAEGTWSHWVDLALMVLADPLTKAVRPDAFREASGGVQPVEADLNGEQLRERFQ